MDPLIVKTTIDLLMQLHKKGALPKADFSLAEMEGLIADHLGRDVSGKQLTAAFGALGVRRTSHRVWDHYVLTQILARLEAKTVAQSKAAVTAG